jgi:hypothetical protein
VEGCSQDEAEAIVEIEELNYSYETVKAPRTSNHPLGLNRKKTITFKEGMSCV